MSRRLPLCVVLGFSLLGLSEAASAAPHVGSRAAPAASVTTQVQQPAVSARAEVRLLPRAGLSRDAWVRSRDQYRRRYVYPGAWPLRLAGCRSRIDGRPVESSPLPGVAWRLEPLEGQPFAPIDISARVGRCATTVQLPALGRWRVTARVSNAAGQTATATLSPSFRDLLVAAVGDSFASGEGNKLKGWTDGQCHRSYAAWPAEVARRMENASTTVTFVSYACSGASISNLIDKPYAGIGGGDGRLIPQLQALRAAIGDPRQAATRTVDVLLGAAGINELGVGEVLEECSNRHPFTACRRDLSKKIARLPAAYDALASALPRNVRLGRAYFAGYPARIFTDGQDEPETCGVFSLMSERSARWITDQVLAVNRHLTAKAFQRKAWKVVATKDLFRTHGYCADDSWFRSWTSSKHGQNNDEGTAHPDLQGHRATAVAVLEQVRILLPATAP